MSNPFKRKRTYLAILASLVIGGGTAYATTCLPPYESLTLELVSVTEDGAPVTDRSAYAQRVFALYPDFGALIFEIGSRDGSTANGYEHYQR